MPRSRGLGLAPDWRQELHRTSRSDRGKAARGRQQHTGCALAFLYSAGFVLVRVHLYLNKYIFLTFDAGLSLLQVIFVLERVHFITRKSDMPGLTAQA